MLIDSIDGLNGFSIPWADGRFLYFERRHARKIYKQLGIKIQEWDSETDPKHADTTNKKSISGNEENPWQGCKFVPTHGL